MAADNVTEKREKVLFIENARHPVTQGSLFTTGAKSEDSKEDDNNTNRYR